MFKPIEMKGVKLDTKTGNEWKKLNRRFVRHINQQVDQSVFHHIAKEVDACSLYERKMTQNKAFMIRRLVNLKYKGAQNVAEHLSNF